MADECKPVEWILLPFEASRISFYKSKYLSKKGGEFVKKVEEKTVLSIIHRLENQEQNVSIAKQEKVSLSFVEKINECKLYTNLHHYKKNIRNENKEKEKYRSSVFNEYIFHQDYVELHIINTSNIEAFGKIDTEDYERVSQHHWSLKIQKKDVRIIGSSIEVQRTYLHQYILKNNNKQLVIDHINRDPLDNRKANLRITTCSINSTNAKPRKENNSGIRGVYRRKARHGIAKASWVCEWSDNKKRYTKSFSIDKYGEDEAFRLATSLRQEKMKEMKI